MPAGRAAGHGPAAQPGPGRHRRLFRRAVATAMLSRRRDRMMEYLMRLTPIALSARHRRGDHGQRRPGPAPRRPDRSRARPRWSQQAQRRERRRAATTRRSTCSRPRSPSIRATAPPISRSAGSRRRSACRARRSAIMPTRCGSSPTTSTRSPARARPMSSAARSSGPSAISSGSRPSARQPCPQAQQLAAVIQRGPPAEVLAAQRPEQGAPPTPDAEPAPRPNSSSRASATKSSTASVSARRSGSMPSVASASSAPGSACQDSGAASCGAGRRRRRSAVRASPARPRRAARPGTMWTTADITLGGGTKAERWTFIASFAVARHWASTDEPAIGAAAGRRDDPLGDLPLEHQGQRLPPGRPGLAAEPAHQQRGADIVGQVGDDMGRADQRRLVDRQRVALDDVQPARGTPRPARRAARGSAGRARPRSPRAPARSRARVRPPGPGPDLVDALALERAGNARDPVEQLLVEEEILAERLATR